MEVTRIDPKGGGKPPIERKTIKLDGPGGRRRIRTACYCRVSTALESQQLSLESQMEGFTNKINETPGMVLAGVYADEGITGTSARKRTQFLKMIEDAREGKIDCIMTKSISRFARNTVECLQYVRELKEMGINVIFEKEAIDTSSTMSEMLLTVLAAFAQEESRSISENLKWGIRKRYELGEFRWSATYGLQITDEKKIIPNPEEAPVVRRIFEMYRTGKTLPPITDILNEEGIPSPRGAKWTTCTLQGLLTNEKYIGDVKLQKYVSMDHITHKCVKNDETEVPSFYVRNSHDGIVDKRTFNQVQRILELRAPRGEITRYPYQDTTIICPFCGKPMVTRQMHVQTYKKAVCCFGDNGCEKFSVKTWMLDKAIFTAFNKLGEIEGKGEAAKRMRTIREQGLPEEMQYYFLADTVKQVTFEGTKVKVLKKHKKQPATEETSYDWNVTVHWQNGQTTTASLNAGLTEEPAHVAALYRNYLERLKSGEYVPTKPKCLLEKRMKEENRRASVTKSEVKK